jgi:orotate phosphoribosyltransferase
VATIDELAKRAFEMKSKKGLTDKEIADELHVQIDTVLYLVEKGQWLSKGKKTKKFDLEAPLDVRIGWRSVGVFPSRTRLLSGIMADIAIEELGEDGADTVVAVAINGVSLGTFLSEYLNLELAVFRNLQDNKNKGTFSSNFAGLKGKRVIIVDDVFGTGETIKGAIKNVKEEGGKPVLCMVFVNKSQNDKVDGVRLRGLVRTTCVGGE